LQVASAGTSIDVAEKQAEAIQQEVTREVSRLLQVIWQDQSENGRLDLEAIEAAMRSAMHQTGAVAPSELLH
jgi:hypothetical protein